MTYFGKCYMLEDLVMRQISHTRGIKFEDGWGFGDRTRANAENLVPAFITALHDSNVRELREIVHMLVFYCDTYPIVFRKEIQWRSVSQFMKNVDLGGTRFSLEASFAMAVLIDCSGYPTHTPCKQAIDWLDGLIKEGNIRTAVALAQCILRLTGDTSTLNKVAECLSREGQYFRVFWTNWTIEAAQAACQDIKHLTKSMCVSIYVEQREPTVVDILRPYIADAFERRGVSGAIEYLLDALDISDQAMKKLINERK